MSGILQEGNRNPLDILIEKFNWDYDVVSLCLNWALGDDWITQPVKEFWHHWNERHADKEKMTLTAQTDPEKAILAIGLLFKNKIAKEQLALRRGAKFGKACPCTSRKSFEKCCGDLLEYYQPKLYKGAPKSKSKFVQGARRIVERAGEIVTGKKKRRELGWYKGPRSVEARYGGDQGK